MFNDILRVHDCILVHVGELFLVSYDVSDDDDCS